MSRSYLSQYSQISVSMLLKETALNTAQTLSHTLWVGENDILDLDPRREKNNDEQTGYEEATKVYNKGNLSGLPVNFMKAKPQDFALLYGFGFGDVVTAAAGATGYKHTFTPRVATDMPGITAAGRDGKTIMKMRCPSLFVNDFTATFGKDKWAELTGSLKGTGKFDVSLTNEEVSAAYNATSLNLAANAVHGSTAQERLDSIHQVRVLVPTTGEYVEVVCTAVSSATPAVLTITAPGGVATSTTYEILYAPTEAAWCSFPAQVDESPLRVTDLTLKVGGKWSGSAFLGGRTLSDEINSVQHKFNNNMKIEFRPGGTGDYANYARRGGREQSISLDREMREYILRQRMLDNEYFGVYMKATGAEYETGYSYYVELVFPKCAVLKAPKKVADKVVAEAGELEILEDPTYGSAIGVVQNKIATIAA